MKIDFKDGVVIKSLSLEMVHALYVIAIVFNAHSLTAVITSGNDSKHGTKSLHYKDRAFDVRLKDVEKTLRQTLVTMIAVALGPKYDVLLEHADHPTNVHVHIEYDPS